ncbi:hypothetical protein ABZT43_20220 [Streptomyces sp. NPDC005349]|uniref:hypothetical protein n=1 Tax=Streptomyces sp. NPDC005349 TaxID=3157037 RepID=UPI0033A9A095
MGIQPRTGDSKRRRRPHRRKPLAAPPTAVRRVDRIFVLDEGRLIEEGSHAELFAAEPASRYAQMYRLQADQYEHGRPARLPGPTRPPASEPA